MTKAPLLAQGQLGDGPQGKPTCPTLAGGGMPCPEFMSPEHLITDNNGDVYNFVYARRSASCRARRDTTRPRALQQPSVPSAAADNTPRRNGANKRRSAPMAALRRSVACTLTISDRLRSP